PLKARLAGGGDRAALFTAVIDELATAPSPALLVLEDIHWADCATLDLVKFLSRRIHRVPALMVVTCRDDAACQELTALLGEIPARHVTRIALPRLSPDGVAALAARAMRSIAGLHDITGGNPFFVSELLRHGGDSLPSTVRDAVLGKAVDLADAARDRALARRRRAEARAGGDRALHRMQPAAGRRGCAAVPSRARARRRRAGDPAVAGTRAACAAARRAGGARRGPCAHRPSRAQGRRCRRGARLRAARRGRGGSARRPARGRCALPHGARLRRRPRAAAPCGAPRRLRV